MDGVTARDGIAEADLPALLALLQACEAHDRLDEQVSLDELREDFLRVEPGWRRDARLWERGGELVAVAGLWGPEDRSHEDAVFGWYQVLPDLRKPAFLGEVLAWMVKTARQRDTGTTDLELSARNDAGWRLPLIERAGMPEARRFDRMIRDLAEPIADAPLPPGYAIRPLAGPDEVPAWVEAFNASFVDHYGFVPDTPERRLTDLAEAGYDPALDFVATAPDGAIAAFCWCDTRTPEGAPVEHWIHLLGTHREHRRLGLASALLAHAMAALRERGATHARLGVDQQSQTGATALYARAGFAPYVTTRGFRRPVRELAG